MRSVVGIVVAALSVSCAGTTDNSPPVTPALVRTAESRSDVAVMLMHIMAAEFCLQVRDRFLPINDNRSGVAARGDEPVGGRWWVRECEAVAEPGSVALRLGGVGWAWVEESRYFWSTSDYVFFAAGGEIRGAPELGYDPIRRSAWMRFRPDTVRSIAGRKSTLSPQGDFVGDLVSTLFSADGYLERRANEEVGTELSKRFHDQLASGFAVVLDVPSRQRDFYSLSATAPPLRPFRDGRPWLANERQVLHRKAGGFHVLGPFSSTLAAHVDFRVEAGAILYRAECQSNVSTWFAPLTRGQPPNLPPVTHGEAGTIHVGAVETRRITTQCPWYLITQAAADHAVVDVRVRADQSGLPAAGP